MNGITNYITIPILATFVTVFGLYFFNYKKYTWGLLIFSFSAFLWVGHNIYIQEWLQALRVFVSGIIGVATYWHWTRKPTTQQHEPLSYKLKRWEHEGYAE